MYVWLCVCVCGGGCMRVWLCVCVCGGVWVVRCVGVGVSCVIVCVQEEYCQAIQAYNPDIGVCGSNSLSPSLSLPLSVSLSICLSLSLSLCLSNSLSLSLSLSI